MKLKILVACLLFSTFSYAQKLSLVGSNFSFAKGNIDVEVLTEIIQQKQDEVIERVFRNLIIDRFNEAVGAEKSFATYSYIYNTLHSLTTEKNKTVITRQIVNNLLEYCLVYGFTKVVLERGELGTIAITKKTKVTSKKVLNVKTDTLLQALETIPPDENGRVFLKDIDDEEWLTFNILLDMAYDIFITDTTTTSLQKKGLFKMLVENPTLKKWYEDDNAYLRTLKSLRNLKSADTTAVKIIREKMETVYSSFKSNTFGDTDLLLLYNKLEATGFKQETITDSTYNAAKNILRKAITALKTYSDNNLIGTISEFLLDYTLIEFAPNEGEDGLASQGQEGVPQKEKKGILYIDAEGLISNLYDKFASNNKRSTVALKHGAFIPRPFFIIGATHSGALNSNNQLLVKDGAVSNLNNIYFANEKIGLKFTFFDRKYTHSFEPGEEFKYRGRKTHWVRPQSEPLISRGELYLYGSGLLYNIVDIKSQENFNYTLVGSAFGITFFNGLMLNGGIALPINAKNDLSNKYLYTLSFDIPIIEYITAVRKKRNKT